MKEIIKKILGKLFFKFLILFIFFVFAFMWLITYSHLNGVA